ncbi:MAG: hypothetical protein ACHREM_24285 [Polyangiales bacterium]
MSSADVDDEVGAQGSAERAAERTVDREIDGLFEDFDQLLKHPEVGAVLTARAVNSSIAMVFADGLRAYLRGDKARAIEDLSTALEEITQRLAQGSKGDA